MTKQIISVKQICLLAILLLSAIDGTAQYKVVKDVKSGDNAPLETFAKWQRTLFNFGWDFRLAGDSTWRSVDLPHDFQIEMPWNNRAMGSRGFKPMGEGWYRKTFDADTTWRGKIVTLDFDGIMAYGDVYVNDKRVGGTDYGYVGFEADITQQLNFDKPNVVTVYSTTGKAEGSRWYTGGGLFRSVYLNVKNPTHIARHGVYITTPEVSETKSTVAIQTAVDNWRGHDITVKARIFDPEGKEIGHTESGMPEHTKQKCVEVNLPVVDVANAKLWSPDCPSLYTAEVVLKDCGVTVDSVREHFGIRRFEFSPEYGMKLNGKKLFLKGNASHHDLGALGAASYDKAIERMMMQLKTFGFNCIRCSHNPYSESFTKIADRIGMVVVDELIDKWSDKDYWMGRGKFTDIWHELIPEWIKRDRNSPSVAMWSLGNELQMSMDQSGFSATNDWGVTTYRIFDVMVKRFDKTRPTTVAMFPARAGAIAQRDKDFNTYLVPPELSQVTEVASFNYQSNRYKDYVKNVPHLNVFQSEAETYTLLTPYYNMDHDHSIGMAYWGAVEYWGESNRWPKKGWNYSFFDHAVHPYPTAWLVKSAFMPDVPTVRIGVGDNKGSESVEWNDVKVGREKTLHTWNFPDSSKQKIFTYTNAATVELIVNGKSLGTKENNSGRMRRNIIDWGNVDYGKGGSVVAIARDRDGKETARDNIVTAGKATALRITAETPAMKADGMDLLYLNVEAVDRKGNVVPTYDGLLSVSVSGAARLIAMDDADHYTNELFNVHEKKMREGRMLLILRSNRQKGKIKLTLKTPDLKKTASYVAD